ERARAALIAQLRSVQPPLSESEITRERLSLEEAVRKVESEAAQRAREAARAPAGFQRPGDALRRAGARSPDAAPPSTASPSANQAAPPRPRPPAPPLDAALPPAPPPLRNEAPEAFHEGPQERPDQPRPQRGPRADAPPLAPRPQSPSPQPSGPQPHVTMPQPPLPPTRER